ncbi:MAG: hypothetical protein L0322_24230 [Chloroflexi bacterium]|nr:hypothetical protein [Chloroflexota bacterium]
MSKSSRFINSRHVARFLLGLVVVALLAACASSADPTPPGCDGNGILIAPTATRPADPDLYSPPAPPGGGDGASYCPTAVPDATPVADFPTGFAATDVTNLSLDPAGQALAAAAVGDDMLAVAWLAGGDVYVALSRGGNHFQVRRVDAGNSVSLAFSRANRLHVAYEQDGQVLYRAADQGTHPADAAPIFVAYGEKPQVVVDELNWAHVLYVQEGSIFKAKHLSSDNWLVQFVTAGETFSVLPFYNEKEVVLFGIPSGAYWFGLLLATADGDQVRLFRYLSWFNLWQQIAVFAVPPGEELTGAAGLDFLAVSSEEAWVTAAWVTKRPNTAPPLPAYSQPIYEAVNPLFPDQIANPGQIFEGLNATRWRSNGAPFDAGLLQTILVSDPDGWLTFSARGLAESAAGADLALRVGLDPTGGVNPDSPTVVWSAADAPAAFSQFSASVPASGPVATVFLEATLNTTGLPATAVWDAAGMDNGDLVNGGFEGPFVVQSSLAVPEGWTAYYEDSGNSAIAGRDGYAVTAAWSPDGGATWSGPAVVAENRDASGSLTGAIRPDVTPLISLATEIPSVTFFTIYETGDPPPGTAFLRFGRPHLVLCALGTDNCADAPGDPLLLRTVARPALNLVLAADPFNPDRALLVWDGLQTDYVNRDVYATFLVMR